MKFFLLQQVSLSTVSGFPGVFCYSAEYSRTIESERTKTIPFYRASRFKRCSSVIIFANHDFVPVKEDYVTYTCAK